MEKGLGKANAWCLVTHHREGQPSETLCGDPMAIFGIPIEEVCPARIEACIIGTPPKDCAWRLPCEQSVYLFKAGSRVCWMESTSVAAAQGGIIMTTRPVPNGDSESFFPLARLSLGGSLLGPLAHEFNNIVQGLASGEYLLRDCLEQGEPVEIEDVEQISEATADLKSMGAVLQCFARLSQGDAQLVLLPRLITRAATLLQRAGRMRIVSFDVVVEENLPDIHWRETELDFILVALLSNAVDASLEGAGDAWVKLSVGVNHGHLELEIRNSGAPIILAKAAIPGKSSKAAHRHAGLGLSTVMALVYSRGGALDVVDQGLLVVLPLQATL